MTQFQALVTGALAGALMRPHSPLLVDVEIAVDIEGNYTNVLYVTGQQSGEELKVTVEPRYDTPESVKQKVEQAREVERIAGEALGG